MQCMLVLNSNLHCLGIYEVKKPLLCRMLSSSCTPRYVYLNGLLTGPQSIPSLFILPVLQH